MGNEAATTIVLRMRDEARANMEKFGETTNEARLQSLELGSALTAMGGALTAVGSLVGKLEGTAADTASTFLITAGAILTTTSAIIQSLPYITKLISALRSLAVTQAVLAAFEGPVGWASLGIAAGAAAGFGIAQATSGGGSVQTTIVNNNVQGSVITEQRLGEITRQEIIKVKSQNGSSGT